MSWYAEKMQHRIVKLNMQNIQVFAKKNMLMISKTNMINKNWQNIRKMQFHLLYNAVFWRLPSCLTYMPLSWGIPRENPRRAF